MKLTKGLTTIVDDEDLEWLSEFSWYATSKGYAATRLHDAHGTHNYMHRMLLNAPKGVQVDHINGNKLDNQRSNLRLCSLWGNMANRPKRKTPSSSKYKGVYFDRKMKKWVARVKINNKTCHYKTFQSEKQAAMFYNEKATVLFGEFAQLNVLTDSTPDRLACEYAKGMNR